MLRFLIFILLFGHFPTSITIDSELPPKPAPPGSKQVQKTKETTIKRVNLKRCLLEEDITCTIQFNCVSDKKVEDPFAIIDRDYLKSITPLSPRANRLLECFTGAITKRIGDKRNMYTIEFHTTIDEDVPEAKEEIVVAEGISNHFLHIRKNEKGDSYPSCIPDCEFIVEKANLDSNPKYWSGILRLIPRVDLNDCFENNPKTKVMCYFNKICIKEWGKEHKMMFIKLSDKDWSYISHKQEILNCEVTAILRYTETPGIYNFEFYTTQANANIEVKISSSSAERSAWIENGTVFCQPNCTFVEDRSSRPDLEGIDLGEYFRIGKLKIYPASVVSSTDANKVKVKYDENNEDDGEGGEGDDVGGGSDAVAQEGETSEKKKEEESNIGTVVIVVACVLVAAIVIAVIIGTIIQHRQAAMIKRRREAIEHAAAAAAAKAAKSFGSGSNSAERKRAAAVSMKRTESQPLMEEKSNLMDEAGTEVTSSTRYSTNTKEI